MPFQSEITNLIAEDIITKNYCSLTNYEDSMSLHLPLLKSYLTFLSEISKRKSNQMPNHMNMNNKKFDIILVGSGNMAREYLEVLKKINKKVIVVGRREKIYQL